MSVASAASRYGPPAALGAISTAALTFAINFLTDGKAGWWWIVLALGLLGLVTAALWGYVLQRDRGGDEAPPQSVAQRDAGVAQQSAAGNGTNISINADNGSTAAWQIETVHLGGEPDNRKPKTQ
jgi:hypothetical protein